MLTTGTSDLQVTCRTKCDLMIERAVLSEQIEDFYRDVKVRLNWNWKKIMIVRM